MAGFPSKLGYYYNMALKSKDTFLFMEYLSLYSTAIVLGCTLLPCGVLASGTQCTHQHWPLARPLKRVAVGVCVHTWAAGRPVVTKLSLLWECAGRVAAS